MTQGPSLTEPLLISTKEIIERRGEPPWMESLLADDINSAGLKYANPGEEGGSVDDHIHHDFIEWWVVLQGELDFDMGDYPRFRAEKGDIVISPLGTRHLIIAAGDGPSLRLIVGKPGSSHQETKKRGTQIVPFPDQKLPPNLMHTGLDDVLARNGEPPWSETLILDDRIRATLICHGPGMTNNAHWHPGFSELWAILKGELTWDVGKDRPLIHAREGDVVFVPKGMRHHITTVGDQTSLRLAIGSAESVHIFSDDDKSAPPPRE